MSMLDSLKKPVETLQLDTKITPETPLLAALAAIDIHPIDQRVVNEYKKEKLTREWAALKARKQALGWRDDDCSSDRVNDYKRQTLEAFKLSGFSDNDLYWFATTIGNGFWDDPRCFAMGWMRMSLDYVEGVPEFIDNKAAQIRAEIPGAVTSADVLRTESYQYDPFLVVKLGKEEYYVDCWDEKGMEVKL